MNQKQGKIIIIVAPSGTGKSSLILRLKEHFPHLEESISYTTRPKRTGDVHGQQYFFLDQKEFEQKVDQGDFLEWAQVHSNYYGTSKSFVEERLNKGVSLLFDLDIQGTDAFKKYFQERAQAIFISPPSINALKERLLKRNTDPLDVITKRVNNAAKEIERRNDYDYLVVNDDFDETLNQLSEIFCEILGEKQDAST